MGKEFFFQDHAIQGPPGCQGKENDNSAAEKNYGRDTKLGERKIQPGKNNAAGTECLQHTGRRIHKTVDLSHIIQIKKIQGQLKNQGCADSTGGIMYKIDTENIKPREKQVNDINGDKYESAFAQEEKNFSYRIISFQGREHKIFGGLRPERFSL
jgi:hypothetical protein